MPPIATYNPFIDASAWILFALQSEYDFADHFKSGAIINICEDTRDPYKLLNQQYADRPYCLIEPAGGTMHPWRTSDSAVALQRYTIAVVTDEKTMWAPRSWFDLKWELLRSLFGLRNDIGTDNTCPIARMVVTDIDEAITDERQQKIPGWVGLVTVECELWISHDVIATYSAGTGGYPPAT